jgi:outer membrane immunogenic protein
MKKIPGLALAGALSVAALPAVAAPPPPLWTWTGFYIGVNGGGVWGRTDTGVSFSPGGGNGYLPISGGPAIVQATGSNRINNSGGLAGGQFGYLWQSGSLVTGLEAAFDWMNAKGSLTRTAGYTQAGSIGQTFTFNETVKTSWLFTFLARAGIDMGAWYPYVTGGLAVAKLNYTNTFVDSFANPGVGAVSIDSTRAGGAVGGGLQWKWDNNWSLRGEYLYMVFHGVNGASNVAQSNFPGNIAILTHNATFRESAARVALSYRFGGPVYGNH